MIHEWNVLKDYEEGDMVIKGDSIHVMNKGIFQRLADSSGASFENTIVDINKHHNRKGLPSYEKIMEEFYENHPEYLL